MGVALSPLPSVSCGIFSFVSPVLLLPGALQFQKEVDTKKRWSDELKCLSLQRLCHSAGGGT